MLEGDPDEVRDWLGPHDLPLTFVPGTRGLVRAEVQTRDGVLSVPDLVLSTDRA